VGEWYAIDDWNALMKYTSSSSGRNSCVFLCGSFDDRISSHEYLTIWTSRVTRTPNAVNRCNSVVKNISTVDLYHLPREDTSIVDILILDDPQYINGYAL